MSIDLDPAQAVTLLDDLVDGLPRLAAHHAPSNPEYRFLKAAARAVVTPLWGPEGVQVAQFASFGKLDFPFTSMGAVTSLDLFTLDELILFAWYRERASRYRRVADIGANLGLHSIVLDRIGAQVKAFEPDPLHLSLLRTNLAHNGAARVEVIPAAVSSLDGEAEFVRVLGNTTGSHISGSKAAPYGDLERFKVPTVNIAGIMGWADLLKIDAEGHEATILTATAEEHWDGVDAVVEVGSAENAVAIYAFARTARLNLYAQKDNWRRVTSEEDMPTSYHDGSLILTRDQRSPWAALV